MSLHWGIFSKWPVKGFFVWEQHESQATIRLNVEVNNPLYRLESQEMLLFFSNPPHIPPRSSAWAIWEKKLREHEQNKFQENVSPFSFNVLVFLLPEMSKKKKEKDQLWVE